MSHELESSINPYAPVTTEPPLAAQHSQADIIRQKYLSHEASIKSMGVLYLLGAFFLVPMGVGVTGFGIFALITNDPNQAAPAITVAVGLLYLAMGVVQGMTGWALRRFRSWARIVGAIFSGIGLLGFPIGTLISGYFLYLLISKKGVYVFSDEYQQVIAATPHIKYKTSIIVWIFLGLLLALIGLGVIAAVIGSFSR